MRQIRSYLLISIACYICIFALFAGQLISGASISTLRNDGDVSLFEHALIRRDDDDDDEKVDFYRRTIDGKTLASAAKKMVSSVGKEVPKLTHQPSLSRSSSSVSSSVSSAASHSLAAHQPAGGSSGRLGRSMTRGNPTHARYHSEPPPGSKKNLAHTSWRNIHLSKETKKNSIIAGGSAALGLIAGNVQFNTPTMDINLVHEGGKKMSMNTQLGQGGISSNLNAGGHSINMNKITRSRSFGGRGSEPEYY